MPESDVQQLSPSDALRFTGGLPCSDGRKGYIVAGNRRCANARKAAGVTPNQIVLDGYTSYPDSGQRVAKICETCPVLAQAFKKFILTPQQ